MENLQSTLKNVVSIVHDVGAFIRTERRHFDKNKIEFKESGSDLVSYVDKSAEKELVTRLGQLLPETGFITEENTIPQNKKFDYQWVIDPLDGTTNFVHGLYPHAVSVALMYKQKVILGVVYEIGSGEMFHAIERSGAYCGKEKLRINPDTTLNSGLIATGFPYAIFTYVDIYLEILKIFMQRAQGLRRMGSAATDLAYLAAGRFDGFFEFGLSPWDVAAGSLLVTEAGGVISDVSGGDQYIFGKTIMAANPKIMTEMREIITPLANKYTS